MNEQTERAANLSRPGKIIDLVALANVLWRRRVFFICGFVLVTVIGALLVFLAPHKFRGEAVFQVGILANKKQDMDLIEKKDMPMDFFKEGEGFIHNLDHMQALMALDQTLGKGIMENFFKAHKKNQEIKKYFQHVYNFSTIMQLPQSQKNAVLGFKLFYEAETSDVARKIVKFFGDYIRSSYLAIDLSKYIRERYEYYNRSVRECENRESELNNKFAWTISRRGKMQLLSQRFPIIKDIDQQQLIFMKNTNTYFLSANINLMATEMLIMDIDDEIKRLTWEKELSSISLKFFSRANELLASDGENGIALLAKANILKRELFAGEYLKSPAVRYVDNSLSIDLQRFQDIYYDVFKFVSGPVVLPDNTFSDRLLKVFGIMIFNLFFLPLLILLIHWGKGNWQKITAEK